MKAFILEWTNTIVLLKNVLVYYYQRRIWDPTNNLRWSFFYEIIINFKLFTSNFEYLILSIWRSPECTFGRRYINTTVVNKKGFK